DRVSFRIPSLTTAQLLRVGLETLDASGDPSGTQYGGSAPATQTPVTATTYEVTLPTPATAVAGDRIALVIQFDSTTGAVNVASAPAGPGSTGTGFPYIDTYNGSVWTRQSAALAVLSIRYNDGLYAAVGAVPAGLLAAVTFNSGSTPDEIGNLINLPFPLEASGFWGQLDFDAAADIILYDGDGTTVLRSVSLSNLYRGGTAAARYELPFSSPVTLAKNTNYRLVAKPTSGSNVSVHRLTCLSAAHLDGMPGGQVIHETSRTDAGAWSQSTAQRILLGLLASKLDDGAGGGGGGLASPFSSPLIRGIA
ncbi:MAG TPA: hypothetical protein VK689_14165, partial [Armatimonadota bacterium]|nr:hypothetical protein [Armatimonadota bacterium]